MESNQQVSEKRCYYDIMGVDCKATADELKRAFKKLSLKQHPDKNRHRLEEAKKQFQEITEAYNCLNDPKERQWYDTNRERLLMNKDDMTREDLEMQSYGFDIYAFMEADCFEGFDAEDENGFYKVFSGCFEKINYEEERTHRFQEQSGAEFEPLMEFGGPEVKIEEMIKFYDQWQNFTTIKNFAWADKHDVREGENRWEKRQMEQENEKERRKEKKQYIATIKDLVKFVKKRDPRLAELEEFHRQEELKKEALREQNKGAKQKKKEEQQRLEEEKRKQKEEARRLQFQKQEEDRLRRIEEQKKEEAELAAKKAAKKKEAAEKTKMTPEEERKLAEEYSKIPEAELTKKQKKLLQKYKKQQEADQERAKQKEIKAQKAKEQKQEKQEVQQQQDSEDEGENEEKKENSGDAKKRKRNRKKKAKAATLEAENGVEENQEPKEWKPQSSDEGEEKTEVVVEEKKEEDEWNTIPQSTKAKKGGKKGKK